MSIDSSTVAVTSSRRRPLPSEGSALSPFTDEQETRLRDIVLDECRAAYQAQEARVRVNSDEAAEAAKTCKRDGISVEIVTMPGGARRGVWRRHSAIMTPAEIDAYLRECRAAPRAGIIRRLATALRAWANRESASDAR